MIICLNSSSRRKECPISHRYEYGQQPATTDNRPVDLGEAERLSKENVKRQSSTELSRRFVGAKSASVQAEAANRQ
ncbi:unnamed protein product [Sphagnum balticum]